MSDACKNPKDHKDHWRVVDRECNYSAFNGYHRTPSRYSSVRCLLCNSWWRTKAAYVRKLKNASENCCDGSKGDDCDCSCHDWKGGVSGRTWCGLYLCCREKNHDGACEVDSTLLTWEDGVSRET